MARSKAGWSGLASNGLARGKAEWRRGAGRRRLVEELKGIAFAIFVLAGATWALVNYGAAFWTLTVGASWGAAVPIIGGFIAQWRLYVLAKRGPLGWGRALAPLAILR